MTSIRASVLPFLARQETVLAVLQTLILVLPFASGLAGAAAVIVAGPLVVGLLLVTLDRRLGWSGPETAGLGALGAFVGIAALSTFALPPWLLGLLAPETRSLYAAMLPGWPSADAWSSWRPFAIDPYAVWLELGRLVLGVGVFAVVTAYPWSGSLRARVAPRLLMTLVATGVLLATLGLRGAGPFADAAHLAIWLETVIPVALGYALTLGVRLTRRLRDAAATAARNGRGRRRAWVTALFLHQHQLWAPLVAAAAVLLMLVAHGATAARGGGVALLLGIGVAGAAVVLRMEEASRGRRTLVGGALVLLAAVFARVAFGGAGDSVPLFGGLSILADRPLLGTGLGAWVDVARRDLLQPANDYVVLAGESGLVGVLLAVVFCIAVVRAVRVHPVDGPGGVAGGTALARGGFARAGLLGGVLAALAHGLIEPGLRVPANLAAVMLLLGLLVASAHRDHADRAPGLGTLTVVGALAVFFVTTNAVLGAFGQMPLSAADCIAGAERLRREGGDREAALALARRAVECAPAQRAAHETMAAVLGPGIDGEAALRRALFLDPWAASVRDRLALRLWRRGERATAAAELEESVFRRPHLAAHPFLHAGIGAPSRRPADVVRALGAGDGLGARVAGLDEELAAAVDRGLVRALGADPDAATRPPIVDDLVNLREARGRWREAAGVLRAEAGREGADVGGHLARAAAYYLEAGDRSAAEKTLLAGLLRAPDDGELYRRLAVDVYAAHGELASADRVLAAGERNASDVLPVRRGQTQVLGAREATRLRSLVGADGASAGWAP